jgi:hypothetical protein
MHPLRNAFKDMPFGANKHGILVVTAAKVAYKSLMAAKSKKFEWIICNKVTACKSSALSKYPCGMNKKNFSNLMHCSHQEKVGILYYLLLALHDQSGHAIFEEAKLRQQEKYNSFPMKKKARELLEGAPKDKAGKKGRWVAIPLSITSSLLMMVSCQRQHSHTGRTCYLAPIFEKPIYFIVPMIQLSLFSITCTTMVLASFSVRIWMSSS